MGRIVLVTGGARSGKSRFAEGLAKQHGGAVVYIATAEASDSEMEARIAKHQAQRPLEWNTIETPLDLQAALHAVPPDTRSVLVECLVLWTSNHLLTLDDPGSDSWWVQVEALESTLLTELQAILDRAQGAGWDLILVTNEVGWSLHPHTALGRAFQDMLGRLNQQVAARADAVYLVVAGLAVDLKQLAAKPVL
jgi:adenosylcobinamide kinase/adenosylcobinamide-phosphate guanylyltransferase